MRKEWKPMQVKFVGQVREVVQGNRGKYSGNGAAAFRSGEEPRT